MLIQEQIEIFLYVKERGVIGTLFGFGVYVASVDPKLAWILSGLHLK